jgi:NAD(P)-dependent dehydrogenase (short-subunit alcohol dehydrogenase family)
MNKTVYISGAEGGIGQALCEMFKKDGWMVIGTDINPCTHVNCDLFFQEDVASAESIKKIHDSLKKEKISIQCVINNAAVQTEKRMLETTEDEWNSVIQTNLGSIFLSTKYLFDLLKDCSIINIASVHARATSKGLPVYAASKGAITSLTRSMAIEFAAHGIRVNAILPGAIETEMLRKGLSRNRDPENAIQELIKAIPLGRIGNPSDVAHLALFLAENKKSSYITGQEFVCDGGVLAKLSSE